jgi:flagellar protein FlgJ
MSPLAAITDTSAAPPAPATDRAALAKAAKQFEAIFVRRMLSAARQTSFDDGLFKSEAMGTFRQMQDDRFADIASERGSFGLGKMIEAHLARFVGTAKEPG